MSVGKQQTSDRSIYLLLALVVIAFLGLGLAYARVTPAWQAPDEPAHFNYVTYEAQRGQLPVLQPGDYPAGRVPIGPEVRLADISGFRYEAHQPPLFYALAAVVYKLHASVFALRALSVMFGAALLPVAFWIARSAVPGQPWVWLGTAAVSGFIPMHLFVAGSVENDTLADLVLAVLLLAVLARWPPAWLGILFGLALLTKATIYLPALLLILVALFVARKGATALLVVQVAATTIVVAGWWFVRNGLTYGWSDVLIQERQAEVAGSQTHTGGLGLGQLWNFVATSFHSFWGQFGWMSIPLPERDYRLLIALTIACTVGWVIVLVRRPKFDGRTALALALTWAGVVASSIGYNLTFLQPQGRYLFPALVPIALAYVVGFAALFPRRSQPYATVALALALFVFSAYTLQRDLIPAFS